MKLAIEIGGSTKVGRAYRRMMMVGTGPCYDGSTAALIKAEAELLDALFTLALRSGWRRSRAKRRT